MQVSENTIVELKYILTKNNDQGEVLEIMDEHWPFKFLFGSGKLLPAFEEKLKGLTDGQSFSFTLGFDEAYGPHLQEKITQVFFDDIVEDHRYPIDNYQPGDFVQLKTQTQQVISGKIHSIQPSYFLVDTNHAMAGINLHFKGMVLNVRQARKDEVLHQRYIEPNGIRSHSRLSEPPNQ